MGSDVVVSCVALEQAPDEVRRLASLLSRAEHERAARFRDDELRRRFFVSHGALRSLLSARVGVEPSALRLLGEDGDKPRLADSGLEFSLSHAGELALVAIGDRVPLGVDVEGVRPLDDPWQVAKTVFSEGEIDDLGALPAARLLDEWFRCWTRKEAVLKALGTGLGLDPRAFEMRAPAFVPAAISPAFPTNASWSISNLDLMRGYVGSLAVMTLTTRVELERWPS